MMYGHGMFWVWGLINLGILTAWFILSLVALFDIRSRKLSSAAKALWSLVVLVIPVMGAVALFIVNPNDNPPAAA